MNDVQGKTAFVTGGASGIGRGIVGAFIDAGMKVVLADLRQDHIEEARPMFLARQEAMLAAMPEKINPGLIEPTRPPPNSGGKPG